jgi:hypothetical protein
MCHRGVSATGAREIERGKREGCGKGVSSTFRTLALLSSLSTSTPPRTRLALPSTMDTLKISALTLDTLPEEILHEILKYILPNEADPLRAACLRTCRAVRDAAGGLLYHNLYFKSPESWWKLIGGPGRTGLLTAAGGTDNARHVKQLRLGWTGTLADIQLGQSTSFAPAPLDSITGVYDSGLMNDYRVCSR